MDMNEKEALERLAARQARKSLPVLLIDLPAEGRFQLPPLTESQGSFVDSSGRIILILETLLGQEIHIPLAKGLSTRLAPLLAYHAKQEREGQK